MQLIAITLYSFYVILEKNGKTLHLLKSKSKPIPSEKKRRKIEIFGTFTDFSKKKNRADSQNKNTTAQKQLPMGGSSQLILQTGPNGQPIMAPPPNAKDAKMS